MPTLILPPRYTEDSIILWRAANAAGWQTERVQGWRPAPYLEGQEVVIYGEPLFGAAMAEALGYALLEPSFDWAVRLPTQHLRRELRLTTLGELGTRMAPAFLKPADDKCFPARVYGAAEALPGRELLPDETPILVAEPVVWVSEYRCFVREGQVVTRSIYARYGELAQAQDGGWPMSGEEELALDEFSHTLLHDPAVKTPPAVVVDVGLVEGRGWAVVEANPCWAAGLYGCDPQEALATIRRACVLLDRLGPDDRPWVIERSGI